MTNTSNHLSEEEKREIDNMLVKLISLTEVDRKLILNSVNILRIRQDIEKQNRKSA